MPQPMEQFPEIVEITQPSKLQLRFRARLTGHASIYLSLDVNARTGYIQGSTGCWVPRSLRHIYTGFVKGPMLTTYFEKHDLCLVNFLTGNRSDPCTYFGWNGKGLRIECIAARRRQFAVIRLNACNWHGYGSFVIMFHLSFLNETPSFKAKLSRTQIGTLTRSATTRPPLTLSNWIQYSL
eukprot:TRINITY_DN3321_c0_g2_i1.p2 TRINITY_DN3321_c0_g2~~TRINITY_DN3321_c0_g2_i1.p2  ORF type:complete len:181 (-),score=5.81 TRINITY_DN3321_c0_g2_i1:451-993(-)